MKKISDLFKVYNARSKAFEAHKVGNIPFVTNGLYNNGVLGFVNPIKGESVFADRGICVSSFCEATVHAPPFLPRGNGGSGLIVLIPIQSMTEEQLYSYSTQINLHRWRFSFSRMVIGNRLKHLPLVRNTINFSIKDTIKKLLPNYMDSEITNGPDNYKWVSLTDICTVERKIATPQNQLELEGSVPYVTTSSKNNGISNYTNEPPNTLGNCLTVALNGSVGETFFQFDDFVTSNDNVVLRSKNGNNFYLLFYIAFIIRRQRWRYNYYRKLTISKLKKFLVPMPTKNNSEIDIEFIKSLFNKQYGFSFIKKYL